MEGVMMRHGDQYAIAVRKPNQEIEVKTEEYTSFIKTKALTKIPFVRGAFNFIDSMVLGMKTLTYSASFFEDEEEVKEVKKKKKERSQESQERMEKVIMGLTVAFSIALSIVIFMLLPYFLSNIVTKVTKSAFVLALIEGLIRLAIFIGYIVLIAFMEDIRRVFMYHGAEHKCINCIEHGMELNVENVRKSSKQHKRCGTGFILIIILISISFRMFIRVDSMILGMVIRVLLMPVIAGVAYEFIKLAGRSENKLVDILSKPGMWTQNLTTREPDDEMIEVAIASVEAVFDWKAYLAASFGEE